jgi:XRE family transcriptional regulator, regulator of sulfur utilization
MSLRAFVPDLIQAQSVYSVLLAVLGATISTRGKTLSVGEAVRALRESKHISVRTLAAESGFSSSFISQVENGLASPSISSLEKIAQALGTSLGQFFNALETQTALVTRAGERRAITSGWSRAEIASLGPAGPGLALESILVTMSPGGTSAKRPVAGTREEFVYVLEGPVSLTLADEELTLESGDSVTIRAGVARKLGNVTKASVRIIIVSMKSSTTA